MKKKILQIGLLVCSVLLSLTGCYKDKGNYDYTNAGSIVTIKAKTGLEFTMTEPIEAAVPVTVTAKGYDPRDLAYEWHYNGKTIGQDSTLRLNNAAEGGLVSGENYLEFMVRDTKYGMRYTQVVKITIKSAYGDGFFILTEDGGVSKVHNLTLKDGDTPNELDMDIFGKVNGEPLGTGPIKLRKNNYDNAESGIQFEWEILQESRTVTVALSTWVESGVVNDEFMGGAAPAGFVGVNGFHRAMGSAVLDRSGNIYVRNHTMYEGKPVPHSGRYSTTPVYIEKGMKVDRMINFDHYCGLFWSAINHSVMHDELNNRMIMLEGYCDLGAMGSGVVTFGSFYTLNMYGPDDKYHPGDRSPSDPTLTFPDLANLGDYKVVNMVARPSWYDFMTPSFSDNFLILKNAAGKYIVVRYELMVDNNSRSLELIDMYALPSEGDFDEQSKMFVYVGGNQYLLYSGGGANRNKLYLFNFETKQAVRNIYDAPSEITAIRSGVVDAGMGAGWMEPSVYTDRVLVGTNTGDVALINMDALSLSKEKATVVKTFSGVGRVVDIEFHERADMYGGY